MEREHEREPFIKRFTLVYFLPLSVTNIIAVSRFFLCMSRPKKKAIKKEKPQRRALPDTRELFEKSSNKNFVLFFVSEAFSRMRKIWATEKAPRLAVGALLFLSVQSRTNFQNPFFKRFWKRAREITFYKRFFSQKTPTYPQHYTGFLFKR